MARERAILISGKDGEAAYVGFIGDTAGRSPEIKRADRSQIVSSDRLLVFFQS